MRGERGQSSVELVGLLGIVLAGGLIIWQLMLAGWAVTSASNAARTGSRVESRGGKGREAALRSLSSPLRGDATARVEGERTRVTVRVPVIVPGLDSNLLTVSKSAAFPRTN